ncbi:MAG TPA: hypothetical protein VJ725_34125 [Thermoanaerobaculia bacterium]|nr:hypothetical protein [Thermoanaerobaculia bacterium]
MNKKLSIPILAIVLAASLMGAGRAEAQFLPSSELLLPYFEIELQDPGSTTLFSVANSLDKPVEIEITVHTNWGIKVLTIPSQLAAHELKSFDLRPWVTKGKLPSQSLKLPELSHFEAALSGERSPQDNLYYSTEIAPGVATGYVRIKALGTPRPAALFGDYFIVDPMQDAAMGDTLVSLDRSNTCVNGGPFCQRHALRYLQDTEFDEATHVVLWSKRVGQPQKSPDPQPRKVRTAGTVYDDSGKVMGTVSFPILSVELVSVADLGLSKASGWVDLTSDQPLFIALHHSSRNHYSIALQTYCLPPKLDPPGDAPGISLRKLTNGEDANTAPGPTIAVGSPVQWEYEVKNTGNIALSKITVTDDQGVDVKCPKSSLEPGESMTCTGKGVAEACQYKNIGKAVGKTSNGTEVSAEDASHYFGGQSAKIDIESAVNGQDADTPTGPEIQTGTAVSWTFVVKNTGDVQLAGIKVTDSKGLAIACPKTSLRPGESMTCTASGTAAAGQFASVAAVTAASPCGSNVTDEDPGHYMGVGPGIEIKKLTNGADYTQAPGASVAVGSAVTWQYVVKNTGKVTLTDVKVTDDKGVAVSCPKTTLAAGESMTCTGSGTAAACQYTNLGTATGKAGGATVSSEDRSWYFGQPTGGIDIEKSTNGQDADTAPGPTIPVGNPVQWTYVVKNTSNVTLSSVAVTDDQGVAVSCPKTTLAAGESMTCTGSGTATAGQYENVGTATAKTPCGATVSDSDASHYFGQQQKASIRIKKYTNGEDADVAPGPSIKVGDPVKWTYIVTNDGEVALSNVKVTDDKGVAVSCPKTTLAAGESMTCTGNGTATAGQYKNIGTATGTPPSGSNVTSSDPSHYYGEITGDEGCTPGYWKNHTDSWPPTGYSPSQKVQSVFGNASLYPSLGSATLLGALSFQGGSTLEGAAGNLLRAAGAALLDASHPGVDYPRTPANVISDVNAALASGNRDTMLAVASALDADNNLGCPLN